MFQVLVLGKLQWRNTAWRVPKPERSSCVAEVTGSGLMDVGVSGEVD